MTASRSFGAFQKILVVNVNWLGDVIFSTPFFRALREAYPKAHIASLLHPRCAEILKGNPCVDEIITYDEESRHKGMLGKFSLILKLKNKKFDTAFILHRSFTKALIALFAGIPERIGYATKRRGFILTRPLAEPPEPVHKVEYFLGLAASAGARPLSAVRYEYYVDETDRAFAEAFLAQNGVGQKDPLVAVCPGGNWDPKRWPKENFAALCDALSRKLGARAVITGGPAEMGLGREIASMMKSEPVMAAGRTNLKQLGAIFERCDFVIANDTGTMHMAVAVGANTIALFGPTSPKLTGPYGEGSYNVISKNETCDIPCYDMACHDNSCMKKITVDEVLAAVWGFSVPQSGRAIS